MRSSVFELNIPAAAAPSQGTPHPTRDLQEKWVQLSGTFTVGSLTLQGTINGTDYEDLSPGALSATGIVEVPDHVMSIRVNKTVNFDNTVALHLVAFDRTEE